ncbi:MAG: hypothetical protein ACXABY_10845 [Candidatus Thorarchaeota archaeon]|jgi:hypothetical protein
MMPNAVAVRVAVPSKGIFRDVIVPEDNPTVGGVLATLDLQGVDYNGQDVDLKCNGGSVGTDHPVVNLDSILVLPDKPTGN